MPPYVKQTWTDSVTPVDGSHMSHIEDGVFNADANATTALARVQVPAVVNGQWLKGVGGAAVWSTITPADVGLPKITTGTLAAGPPGSPADGDIWVATTIDVNVGTRWAFQYNAGSASAYKWEFIGGSPIVVPIAPFTTNFASTFSEIIAARVTLARAGEYRLVFSIQQSSSTAAATMLVGIFLNGAFLQQQGGQYNAGGANMYQNSVPVVISFPAGSIVAPGYWENGTAGAVVAYAAFEIQPRRVS